MDFSELIAAADPSIFTESIKAWVSGLNINSVIMLIMMIFMIVGAIDRIRGNKLGYGEKFEDGFNAIGGLAIAMAGVYAAAPVLSMVLGPIISPIYTAIGAGASMFATTILACDMGGYPLAMELASDPSIGNFAGLILGTMMGPTIVFTIPVALGIIKKEDRPYLGAGVLAGMITIPIGCIVGGLVMNMTPYKMDIGRILINLVPVIVIAALIVIGLWFAPGPMINGFNKFGTGVTVVITVLTAIAVFQQITGIMFPVFDVMSTVRGIVLPSSVCEVERSDLTMIFSGNDLTDSIFDRSFLGELVSPIAPKTLLKLFSLPSKTLLTLITTVVES